MKMKNSKSAPGFAKAAFTCGACFSVLASNPHCTDPICPRKEPDIPVEQQYNFSPPYGRQTIVSTATGTARDTNVSGTITGGDKNVK